MASGVCRSALRARVRAHEAARQLRLSTPLSGRRSRQPARARLRLALPRRFRRATPRPVEARLPGARRPRRAAPRSLPGSRSEARSKRRPPVRHPEEQARRAERFPRPAAARRRVPRPRRRAQARAGTRRLAAELRARRVWQQTLPAPTRPRPRALRPERRPTQHPTRDRGSWGPARTIRWASQLGLSSRRHGRGSLPNGSRQER